LIDSKADSELEEAYETTKLPFSAFLEKTFLQMKNYSDE